MSMSAEQASAFQAMGGFQASQSLLLILGLVFALVLLYSAWAIGVGYRGWASGQLSNGKFGGLIARLVLLYAVLTYFLLQ